MSDIPLVKSCYAKSIADTVVSAGVPVSGLLRKARLSERLIEVPDGVVPFRSLQSFVAAAALKAGWFELGAVAGARPYGDYAPIGRNLLIAPTLYQALADFCAKSKYEDQTARFWLEESDDVAWFCCKTPALTEEGLRQCETFRYQLMLQMIRWVAGPEWLPRRLAVQSQDDGRLRDVAVFRDVNVRFGSPIMAFGVDKRLLVESLPMPAGVHAESVDESIHSALEVQGEEYAMRELLRSLVLAGQCKLDDLSKFSGLSVRTLQRRFAGLELTFSDVLMQTRCDLATGLLCEQGLPVGEVAHQLGFKHATHFSRFFKQIFGVSPREYRMIVRH